MKFKVRRYKGDDDMPQNGYEGVEAENAQEAAEKVCGESLTAQGPRWKLRATVHTNPGEKPLQYYYAIN